jgi:hypothetical protein
MHWRARQESHADVFDVHRQPVVETEEAPFETLCDHGYDEEGDYIGTGEPEFMAEWPPGTRSCTFHNEVDTPSSRPKRQNQR